MTAHRPNTAATRQRLTDKTLFPRFAQMVGTPLYMSPEQAEMSGLATEKHPVISPGSRSVTARAAILPLTFGEEAR